MNYYNLANFISEQLYKGTSTSSRLHFTMSTAMDETYGAMLIGG
jgi:hypothetical protein